MNLTTEKIIEIHNEIIERYGGTKGILNSGTIDFLVYRLDKETDVFKRAALTMEIIIKDHPFVDGQKRTGFQIADLLLREEGYHIHTSKEEVLRALLKMAKYKCTAGKIEEWLKRKTRKL